MLRNRIPFNKPLVLEESSECLNKLLKSIEFSGNGYYSELCAGELEKITGAKKIILTPSCTAALEMCALICDIKPGDEVIMPSYTFVSTASAFELRKANIVWCDIREDTKNIDETKIEALMTAKTKAIVVVHYAGVACEMDTIQDICTKNGLMLIEDAAQAIDCYYKGKHLGSIGDLGVLSFHETKNIQCGEGGALLVNIPAMIERAKMIRDKGTNRIHFNQGIVDKYTWVELGSNFLMSELQAAFLYPQLIDFEKVNNNRLVNWEYYCKLLSEFIPEERLPYIPDYCKHNAHMFYLMCKSIEQRTDLIKYLKERDVSAIFHYVPLHKAPYWRGKYDEVNLPITEKVSETLLRLPMYYGLKRDDIKNVVESIKTFIKE